MLVEKVPSMTTSASRQPSSISPPCICTLSLTFSESCSSSTSVTCSSETAACAPPPAISEDVSLTYTRANGAPGCMAVSGSITTGSCSYSTSTASTPSSAAASVSASTMATGCPHHSASSCASGDCERELLSGLAMPNV